ncbi:MBL fold metallo-hydrolase [Paenibacillus sp. TRM 82003]|nr:MBL fold metallo-hydrolase [Paenibacillus sp. TRM 82003]
MNATTPVELHLLQAGYCTHPEFLTIRGGRFRPVRFPAGFACIRHPSAGVVLFDTGYSSRFFRETSRLPDALYRYLTPVQYREEDAAAAQLSRRGIDPAEVRMVILSHFHADHIGGARDFPNARFLYKREAYEAVARLRGLARVRAGFLPGLLPPAVELLARSGHIEDCARLTLPAQLPYDVGYDLLGDGSLIAVDVPGHAPGQIGVFLRTAAYRYFLCADAVWSSRAFRERRRPNPLAGLILADRKSYGDSFERLCRLSVADPSLRIVPSHCSEALRRSEEAEGGRGT